MNISEVINQYIDSIKELRKKLNVNAELSFVEFNTQSIILDFLKDLDVNSITHACGHDWISCMA